MLKGKTILVAEDEQVNFLYIKLVLAATELNILHAKNGTEAIELCKKHPEVRLCLIDLKMPVMNGVDCAKELKKMYPDLPLIAQTAFSPGSDPQVKDLFDSYITKPINKDYLKEQIAKYISG